jgi:glycosyltransferase involved in cell wall biosynthesis
MVHNHYGSGAPSGENLVFALERDLLRRNGHDVETLERFSDTLRLWGAAGAIAGAAMTPWNPLAARAMAKAMTKFRPDVVHVHNTFPMISPSVFAAAKGAARVLTLHNYRLLCPAAIPMRQGETCTECIDQKSVVPAMRHGCYRGSRLATLPLAANIALNRWRRTWQRDVEAFIALSDFQRNLMAHAALPKERIFIKPNFYPGTPKPSKFEERPQRVVFAGRLSPEKGVRDLIDAWLAWGEDAPELRIIGHGALWSELTDRAAGAGNISFLGQVDSQTAEAEIGSARLLILPSRWFEGFPLVLREAFALGTPIAVSNKGPLPEIAAQADGLVFDANNPKDLYDKVSARWSQSDRLAAMAKSSSLTFEAKYSERENLAMLIDIYKKAVGAAKVGQY